MGSPEIKKVKNLPSGQMRIPNKMKMDKKPKLISRSVPKKKVEYESKSLDVVTEDLVGSVALGQVEPDENDDISDLSEDEKPLQSAAELLYHQFGGGDNEWGEEEDYY